MKLTFNWLKEWLPISHAPSELAEGLTRLGLELESLEKIEGDFEGVVVGEVVACEPHPNADKLKVCQVNIGKEALLNIVCGASNVKAGMRVPVATVGGRVGTLAIGQRALRGVESFGMICSAQELGLAEKSEGILPLPADAPIGENCLTYFALPDFVFDIDLTPNRGDCLSVMGVAREASIIEKSVFTPMGNHSQPVTSSLTFPVKIEVQQACPRYIGRVIEGVNNTVQTPMWMQQRLTRCGLRSIDPLVDITNYVMLELGQPLHAFDLASLSGGIVVRFAKEREELVLLDDSTAKLDPKCLVIADHEKPLALAGVMGGKHSAVSSKTQTVFLESAFFAPEFIAGRARQFNLVTDSSHRFERGVDPELQQRAIERATQLILEILGGQAGKLIECASTENLPVTKNILLRKDRLNRVLGCEFSSQAVDAVFQSLGMECEFSAAGWNVMVPAYRFDVAQEIDLIEEMARVIGYDNISPVLPVDELIMKAKPDVATSTHLTSVLIQRGFNETINYAFLSPKLQADFIETVKPIALLNPISSELSEMRVSLLPGLLQGYLYNRDRQQSRIRFCESGVCFYRDPQGHIIQERRLAALASGESNGVDWSSPSRPLDFYDMKGIAESLLFAAGVKQEISIARSAMPALHPGQQIQFSINGKIVGYVGGLHPLLKQRYEVTEPLFLLEMNLDAMPNAILPSYGDISRFPSVKRDLALVVPLEIDAANILACIRKSSGNLLKNIQIFDLYQGEGIPAGYKSLAVNLFFVDNDRTLVDEEVTGLVENISLSLNREFGVTLRE